MGRSENERLRACNDNQMSSLKAENETVRAETESLKLKLSTLKAENVALKQKVTVSKWQLARHSATSAPPANAGGKLARLAADEQEQTEAPSSSSNERGAADGHLAPTFAAGLAESLEETSSPMAARNEGNYRATMRAEGREKLMREFAQGSLVRALLPAFARKPDFEPVRSATRDMIRVAFLNGKLTTALKQVSSRAEMKGS